MERHRILVFAEAAVGPIRARVKQSLVLCLCSLLFGQTQLAIAVGQEPAPQQEPIQHTAKPAVAPASVPETAEVPQPADQDAIPSAPAPQLSLLAQQSQSQPPQAQQSPQRSQQPAAPQQPVGTAAAPYEKPTGVPGSRPAGAAIAPAKQKRVRAIVIRVGLILAGAGAVGAVVGLSKASHSQP